MDDYVPSTVIDTGNTVPDIREHTIQGKEIRNHFKMR